MNSPNEIRSDIEYFKLINNLPTVSQKKDSIQDRAIELARSNSHVLLEWATGCGKTLAALKIIKDHIDKGDTKEWFIVCSELNHIDNWIADIVKHKLSYLMEYIQIFCYASLGKYKNKDANLILDECHSVSDLRLDHLRTIKSDKIISLSATLNNDRKDQLHKLQVYRSFTITMTDAINCEILPSPKIYVFFEKPNTTLKTLEYIKTKGTSSSKFNNKSSRKTSLVSIPKFTIDYSEYFQWLVANKSLEHYILHVKCTEKEYYELITNDMNYYKKQLMATGAAWCKNKMLRLGNERKTYIANSKSHILADLTYVLGYNNYRFIGFTGSIEQCDTYNNAIHSKVPAKRRKELIDKFNTGKINNIFAVQMLREGMNLDKIEAGIITQLDSEDLSFVQMMGRVFRSTNPILFVIIKDDTQDVLYLNKCMEGLDKKFVTYVEYNNENIQALKSILCQEKQKRLKEQGPIKPLVPLSEKEKI